jgi:hypothetical protein
VIGEQFGVGLAIDFGHQVLRVADLGDVARSEIKSGATANVHLRLAGVEALGIGVNDLGADRARGERIACGDGTRHEATRDSGGTTLASPKISDGN